MSLRVMKSMHGTHQVEIYGTITLDIYLMMSHSYIVRSEFYFISNHNCTTTLMTPLPKYKPRWVEREKSDNSKVLGELMTINNLTNIYINSISIHP
jgi:hypothetical protein